MLIIVGVIASCGLIGGYVSAAKNRPVAEGALIGVLLGPLGVLVAALLPTRYDWTPRASRTDQRNQFCDDLDEREDAKVQGWLRDGGLRNVRD